MLAAVLSGYFIAVLAPFIVRVLKGGAGALMAVVPAFLFAFFLQFVPEAADGRPWRFAYPWGGPGGLEAAFWLDSLALTFALLITGLTAVASLATAGLTLSDRARTRLLFALMSLMSSALCFVLTDMPVLLMSAAVLATLSVYLALTARRGGPGRATNVSALIVLLAGDLALIGALGGAAMSGGTLSLYELANRPMADNVAGEAIALLLLAAGFTRFALIPADLRSRSAAMSEPAALVSYGAAYLPLTLYVALRFAPILGEWVADRTVLGLFGGVLLIMGGITGLRAVRLRTLVAGVTALMMGMACLELATFDAPGITVAILILLAHGLGIAVLFLAAQMISGGSAIELEALKPQFEGRPLVLVLLLAGVLTSAGLIPSLGLLTLSTALGAGLGESINPAEIAFMTIGYALQIAVLLRIVRSLIGQPSEAAAVTKGARNLAPLVGGFALLGLVLVLGWRPNVLGALVIDPIVGPPAPLGPFWPQGIAIAFAGAALVMAAVLLWFDVAVRRALTWLSRGLPRRPASAWRAAFAPIGYGARRAARATQDFGYGRVAVAITLVLCGGFVWLGISVIGGPPPVLQIKLLPAAAFASVGALAALLMVFQRSCEQAVPLLAISGALAALTMLTALVIDLAYLMLLVLVLETAILLILGPRIVASPRKSRARLGPAMRASLAVIAGAGATLVAILAPASEAPSGGWGVPDQFQLWSAIVTLMLVLGVIVTDVNRRRMSGVL